jgi:hypothetical protein
MQYASACAGVCVNASIETNERSAVLFPLRGPPTTAT